MKEIFDKISSYNLFNYLLPGILFVCISKQITNYNFIQDNDLIGAFLYYFIGMVISRFGSLFIEPILKKLTFLKLADYKSFVSASKKDEKIELLSEVNNTYRTITAMFVILLIVKTYNHFQVLWNIPQNVTTLSLVIIILLMFLFSYRKQTNYITKRIDANENPNNV
jgi:signal transduction histidine kinase